MDTNSKKKEIIESSVNENETANTKKVNNITYLLPIKILMFLAAIPMVLGLIGVIGKEAVDGRIAGSGNYKAITDKDSKADTYEDSNFFLNDINNLSRYLISNYYAESNQKFEIDENSDIFKTVEYKDVVTDADSSTNASGDSKTKIKGVDDKLKTTHTLKEIYSKSDLFKTEVEEHSLRGSEYELFYYDLSKYYTTRSGKNMFNSAEYLHLTNDEYVELLDKYLTTNYYKFKDIDEFENLDEYGDAKAYYSESLNKGVLVIPHESVTVIDFNSNMNRAKDTTNPERTYEEAFLTEDDYLEFSYSFDDLYVNSSDIYIPMDFINFDSYERFVDSIITTPFVRNIEALAAFYVENNETYKKFDSHIFYDASDMLYDVSYDVNNATERISCGSFGSSEIIKFNPKNSTFDNGSTKRITAKRLDEIKAAFYNVEEFSDAEIKEAYSHFGEISFAGSTDNELEFFVFKYANISVAMMFAGMIIFLICLFMITAMENREVLKTDRWFFEVKTIIVTLIVAALVSAGGINASELLHYGQEGIYILSALFILFAIISFTACLTYYLGLVRLLKNHEFSNNVLIIRGCKFIGRKCKHGSATLKDLFNNFSLGTKTLGITVAYGFVNFFLSAVAACASVASGTAEPIALAVLILIIFNICFVIYKWKEKRSYDKISEGIEKILNGELDYQIDTSDMTGIVKDLSLKVNRIGEGLDKAVAASIKDERMKAELITNVSHDIKTPLTSIINYVDLIKREGIKDEPLKGYIDVLDMKSMRLKSLIEDLLEASKASTGNIELNPTNLNLHELISQITAEYEDKFSEKNLNLIANEEDDLTIYADGRRIYRVIDNIFQNAYKYAMPNTRVYLDTKMVDDKVNICLKNVSEQELNIEVEELLERFTRGDESRNTEGNGLGLSIASNLTKLQDGEFNIGLDGDLFKIMITMPKGR